jgi:hypothetical protein
MPDYYIDIPFANGIRFVPVSPAYDPRYNHKHFDDFWFTEQILEFEQQVTFYHKVQQNDKRKIYVRSSVGTPQITVYNCSQKAVVGPISMIRQTTSLIGQPYEIYVLELDFATMQGGGPLAEGVYWLFMQAGAGSYAKAISEGIDVKALHINTMVAEWTHDENDFDVMFEIPDLVFQSRIESVMKPVDMEFKRKRNSYDDQVLNHKTISSVPYRTYKWIIGAADGSGVAPWQPDMMNFAFGCASFKLDGVEFSPDEGAEFEKAAINGYPKAAYTITMREAKNQYSKRVFAPGSGQSISIVYGIRTRLFGSLNAPASTINIQITNVD